MVLYKPVGAGSQQLLRQVRRLFGTRRAGHAGTLDPFASGVLPVAVGRATRLIDHLHAESKEYIAGLRLGLRTDTGDVEGTLVGSGPLVAADALAAVLPHVIGEISQVPPAYSAVRVGGTRAYALARRGRAPVLQPRRVTIHELEIISFQADSAVLRVVCSSGTYIRSLAEEIAARAGTAAYLESLVRTRVGPFGLDIAYTPAELDEAVEVHGADAVKLHPDEVLLRMPAVALGVREVELLLQGQSIPYRAGPEAGAALRVYAEDGSFVGLADTTPGGLHLRLLLK